MGVSRRRQGESAAWLLAGLGGGYTAYSIATLDIGRLARPGPAFFPIAIGVLLTLTAIGLALGSRQSPRADGSERLGGGVGRAWRMAALLIVVGFLLRPLGFVATLTVAGPFMSRLLDARIPILRSATVAFGSSLVLYLLFTKVFGIPLPTGFL